MYRSDVQIAPGKKGELLLFRLLCFTGRTQAVKQVHNAQPWMGPDQARAGIAHNFSDAAPLFWSIAMDRAFGAGAFAFLEGAVFKACQGIAQ